MEIAVAVEASPGTSIDSHNIVLAKEGNLGTANKGTKLMVSAEGAR